MADIDDEEELSSDHKIVYVTDIIDPDNFYAILVPDTDCLKLFKDVEKLWGQAVLNLKEGSASTLEQGQLVIIDSAHWNRRVRANVNCVFSEDEVDVLCIDYGTSETVPTTAVYLLSPDSQIDFPPQAAKCQLAGVNPIAASWITRAKTTFESLVLLKELDMQLCFQTEDGINCIEIMIEEEDEIKSVSSILANDGLARICTIEKNNDKESMKVPAFNIGILKRHLSQVSQPNSPESKGDNFELEYLRKNTDNMTPYVNSDATIETGFQSNVSSDIFQKVEEDMNDLTLSSSESVVSTASESRQNGYPSRNGSRSASAKGKNVRNSPTRDRDYSSSPLPKKRGTHGKRLQDTTVRAPRLQSGAGDNRKKALPIAASQSEKRSRVSNMCSRKNREVTAENENERKSFEQKIRKLVKECEDVEFITSKIKTYLYTKSNFGSVDIRYAADFNLPENVKVEVCTEILFQEAVENIDKCQHVCKILPMFTVYSNFPNAVSELVWSFYDNIFKNYVITKKYCRDDEPKIEAFCVILTQLFKESTSWTQESCDAMEFCMSSMLKKWTSSDYQDCELLSGYCLLTVVDIASEDLDNRLPEDFQMIADYTENVLKRPPTNEEVFGMFSELSVLLPDKLFTFNDETKEVAAEITGNTYKDVSVQVELSIDPPASSSSSCCTCRCKYCPSDYATADDESDTESTKPDPYQFVKAMLEELELEDQIHLFIKEGIRDMTVKTLCQKDLKDLLKECNIKTGMIYDIRNYISNYKGSQLPSEEKADTKAPVLRTPQSFLMGSSSTSPSLSESGAV